MEIGEKEGENSGLDVVNSRENVDKIGQNQVYDLVTGRQSDWQAIIYELIHTEQLDPWDIDISVLTKRYFEKILEMEEGDFYVSSKVLLAAALLLRVKSEFLLNKHLKSIDDILFGKKEEKRPVIEKIEIDENELPILIPRTPLPRQRKVTLDELMGALNHAINTESRRIKREVAVKRAKKLSEVDFPSFKKIDLKDRIKQFYARILTSIKKKEKLNKIGFNDLIGKEREERLACFLPLLHLSNHQKLWLTQDGHLDEIWIFLFEYFDKNREEFIEDLEEDIEDMKAELAGGSDVEITEVQIRKIAIRKVTEEVSLLFKEVSRDEKIEEISGFSDE
jgi:segregation and condensation protein A